MKSSSLQTTNSLISSTEDAVKSRHSVFIDSAANSLITATSNYQAKQDTSKQKTEKDWFSYNQNLTIKDCYTIEKIDINRVTDFIAKYKLADFLIWIHQPIIDLFGHIEKTLSLFKCWDEEEAHLVLAIYSELDDMDEVSRLESLLFEKLDNYSEINHVLTHLVIAQR